MNASLTSLSPSSCACGVLPNSTQSFLPVGRRYISVYWILDIIQTRSRTRHIPEQHTPELPVSAAVNAVDGRPRSHKRDDGTSHVKISAASNINLTPVYPDLPSLSFHEHSCVFPPYSTTRRHADIPLVKSGKTPISVDDVTATFSFFLGLLRSST